MNRKIKLVWIGDSPSVTTGFGRVSQAVLEALYRTGKYDIAVLGVNHPVGVPHRYEGMFKIYAALTGANPKDMYGFSKVNEVLVAEQPDIVIINCDLWLMGNYFQGMPTGCRVITYSPVDAAPVLSEWIDTIDKVGCRLTTYTDFAKNEILQAKLLDKIHVIGHGIDTDVFYPIEDARKFTDNLNDDMFIIQNVNRNQPRKRIDLFLKACQKFIHSIPVKDREKVVIYYHGSLRDVGWNLIQLAERWGIKDNLLVSNQEVITSGNGLPIQSLNKLYNCADVHVNTSLGEGFGLSPFESAACKVAQVVPNHSACTELWEDIAPLIDIHHTDVLTGGINTEGKVIDTEHLATILRDLFYDRAKTKELGQAAYDHVKQEKFTWEYVAHQFEEIIVDVLVKDQRTTNINELKEEVDNGIRIPLNKGN